MQWSLYEKSATGDWFWVRHCPTGDRCKTVAKGIRNSDLTENANSREFLIRDPARNDWMKSVKNSGWRMKWEWVK